MLNKAVLGKSCLSFFLQSGIYVIFSKNGFSFVNFMSVTRKSRIVLSLIIKAINGPQFYFHLTSRSWYSIFSKVLGNLFLLVSSSANSLKENDIIFLLQAYMQICHLSSSIYEECFASLAVSLINFGYSIMLKFRSKEFVYFNSKYQKKYLPSNSSYSYAVWLKALLILQLLNFSIQPITLITSNSVKNIYPKSST